MTHRTVWFYYLSMPFDTCYLSPIHHQKKRGLVYPTSSCDAFTHILQDGVASMWVIDWLSQYQMKSTSTLPQEAAHVHDSWGVLLGYDSICQSTRIIWWNELTCMFYRLLIVIMSCHGQAWASLSLFNTLRPRQNGRHFFWRHFEMHFLQIVVFSFKFHWKLSPNGPINNNLALVQIVAWRRWGDKPSFGSMMAGSIDAQMVTKSQ